MKYIFTLTIILLFFTSSTSLTKEWIGSNTAVYIFLLLPLIYLVFFKKIKFEYNSKLTLLIILFTFVSMFSALINSDLNIFFSAIGYSVLFLVATVIIPTYYKNKTGKIVVFTILISQIPIILFPILANGIDAIPYKGAFFNSNSFGGVVTVLFVVTFAMLLQKLESFIYSKKKVSKLILLFLFIASSLSFLLVIISGSRTSFLTIIIVVSIGILFLLLYAVKYKLVGTLLVRSLFILPIGGFILWVTIKILPINMYLEEVIFSKFSRKSNNILDGRDLVWGKAFNESGLFGNGSKYFSEEVGLGAHNTFISILGQYGWIAFIIFVVLILVSLYYCFRYTLSNNNYKYLPLLMIVAFISLSMGEVMLYKLSMIATFILIGVVANNKKVKIN